MTVDIQDAIDMQLIHETWNAMRAESALRALLQNHPHAARAHLQDIAPATFLQDIAAAAELLARLAREAYDNPGAP